MLYLGIGLLVAVLYLDFRLGSVSEANADGLRLVIQHVTEATQSVHQELGSIRAELDDVRRCPDCEKMQSRSTGSD
jgi:hypothetical protein